MNVDETIKYSAAAALGEIQRALKIYEVFKDAEKILQVLAQQESRTRELEKEAKNWENYIKDMEKKDAEALEFHNKNVEATQEEVKKAKEELKKNKEKAEKIILDAKLEAEKIIGVAKTKAETYLGEIKYLQEEKNKAALDYDIAKDNLNKILLEVERKKKEILKAFE